MITLPDFAKVAAVCFIAAAIEASAAEAQLPPEDAEIAVEAQEWPLKPGPRVVMAKVFYPGGRLANVKRNTGLLLTLHNWGGKGSQGTADPVILANKLNVIAITVDYLQSGEEAFGPLPYDHGLYQAVDVLRVLHAAFSDLKRRRIRFDSKRIYAVGGSGGGNVALMAHRLAPRTFAGVLAMSAPLRMYQYGPLSARWAFPVPANEDEIRDLTDHWQNSVTHELGSEKAPVLLIHGMDDEIAPYADAEKMARSRGVRLLGVDNLLNEVPFPPFTDAGHSLGDRTAIALQRGAFLLAGKRKSRSKTDFEWKDYRVRYPVTGGAWVMDFKRVPTLKWVGR